MAVTIGLQMRVVDIFLGILGLLLILRVVLQIFGMRWNHPALRVVVTLTDPVIAVTNRLLGIPSYRSTYRSYAGGRSDMLSAVAGIRAGDKCAISKSTRDGCACVCWKLCTGDFCGAGERVDISSDDFERSRAADGNGVAIVQDAQRAYGGVDGV